MKLKEIRIAKGIQQKDLSERIGTNDPMLSRIENYKCLPIPDMMQSILWELDCQLGDIYEPEEIAYCTKKTRQEDKRQGKYYKVTVRLPKEAKELIKEALPVCGYKDVTYWIFRCYERLRNQYDIINKAKEKTPSQPASKR